MKLVTTIKIVNLESDPEIFEDGEMYFNTVTNKIRLAYDGLWSNLVDEENLELSFARRVTEIEDLEEDFSYIIVSADQNTILITNSASHVSFIVPNDLSHYIDIGTSIKVVRGGEGSVDFVEEDGVTIQKADNNYLTSRWTTMDLIKINTNQWILDGEYPDIY